MVPALRSTTTTKTLSSAGFHIRVTSMPSADRWASSRSGLKMSVALIMACSWALVGMRCSLPAGRRDRSGESPRPEGWDTPVSGMSYPCHAPACNTGAWHLCCAEFYEFRRETAFQTTNFVALPLKATKFVQHRCQARVLHGPG